MNNDELNAYILEAIDTITNTKLSKLKFDKTYHSAIIGKEKLNDQAYTYTVIINGTNYTVPSYDDYPVGKQVWVRVPNGDFANLYIDRPI